MSKIIGPVAINRKFTGIASTYEMDVTHLYADQDAVRVKYKIMPPLQKSNSEEGFPAIAWRGYARDNQKGEYESVGGAFGLSSDGQFTDGVLSFLPLPDEGVNRLDITMVLILQGRDIDTKCKFSVEL